MAMKSSYTTRWDTIEREANPSLFSKNAESNQMVLTNVALVSPDNIHSRISYVTDLIQSGEAEKYDFHSGNGEQATNSIHQYLYWLQQRAADLDSDGTYSPEMFR
ncbi:hypothetical protein [Ciceribacter sp. RN22]|uniref:hypothetical protein n=1 Tax=Ciceribacter sp. RN22 TaxID=2954932 RepID=UPI002093208C|nr:hypothetical protein [Ciceribacter sp. RN22]MCO6179290.1 hypothetical protein [Ciceribacter sp. RN22]